MRNTFILVAALLLTACGSPRYKTHADGVVVNVQSQSPNETQKVRLQVINDKIIRVSATPDKEFKDEASLIVIPQEKGKKTFNVEEKDNHVILSTPSITATVDMTTGEVVFADSLGNTILQERTGGGKSFEAITVEGTDGYSMQQVFESPEDEAFYGLGQHQADEFNYKGKNEELFQYNTKVSVPFIFFIKHYDFLWTNSYLGRFVTPTGSSKLK